MLAAGALVVPKPGLAALRPRANPPELPAADVGAAKEKEDGAEVVAAAAEVVVAVRPAPKNPPVAEV